MLSLTGDDLYLQFVHSLEGEDQDGMGFPYVERKKRKYSESKIKLKAYFDSETA